MQRSRADDLTSWYRLLATLGSTLPPHSILDFVLPMLKERMPLEEMAVFLTGRNGLHPIYCTGPKADREGLGARRLVTYWTPTEAPLPFGVPIREERIAILWGIIPGLAPRATGMPPLWG